jgi:hypothetical protein
MDTYHMSVYDQSHASTLLILVTRLLLLLLFCDNFHQQQDNLASDSGCVLTDILGMEDALGTMDFKVTTLNILSLLHVV